MRPEASNAAGVTRRARIAVILAAGQGTRMRSTLPKVLHKAAGRPLLAWVLDAARAAACERILVIVGHGADQVRAELAAPDVEFVLQAEQRGTGHALQQVEPYLRTDPGHESTLIVLSGDAPLVTPATIEALAARAESETAWGALAVAELADPGSLGRVFSTTDGALAEIVEARDATPEQRAQKRINAGLYAFPAPEVFEYLHRLRATNAQGELYLTDAVTDAARAGHRVELHPLADPSESWGINDRVELAQAHRRLIDRHLEALMRSGVTILEPARTSIEPGVAVGRDALIHPDVSLSGATEIGTGCELRQGAWLRNTVLGEGVTIEPYSVLDSARIEAGCRVGPFARLRPGTVLRAGVKIGNFVEVKASELGPGAKAGHLAYLGDATVGAHVNIGAGVITCNYDGESKHRTEIGEGAFLGSDTMLVAPVKVGAGAQTGAGSVITQDVPEGALALTRVRQKNLEGAVERLKGQRRARAEGK
ncbi:MAG TPA: bifunctional UDP-N-acetylglucosamine diphosphorylase/glucosamine-1-phosphate N-acetyltransferase GlmU [Thermoanaerobaculia bacterium]|nr:bifunctional UDP-N-acetylglucosamine diphosphorylase/glucosamine-1-phosphate N-acetyltransferase GlmU [Thermoanaerobaculia bacterium]